MTDLQRPSGRVVYKAKYKGNEFEIECWAGTPLDIVWDSQKSWFLPGSEVTITDNHGNSKTFMRGVKG